MIDPSDVHGKRIAMVAWGKKPDSSKDVTAFTGIASWDGAHLTMLRDPGPDFTFPDEWLDGFKPVHAKARAILMDAEYSIDVTMNSLPDGANLEEYVKTGLMWPKGDDAS